MELWSLSTASNESIEVNPDANSCPKSNAGDVDADDLDSLKLSLLPGVGPRTMAALLERFDTPDEVFAASERELASVSGVGPKLVHTIRTADHFVDVDSVLDWCHANRTRVLIRGRSGYPDRLMDLPDAPLVLFSQGGFTTADEIAVGIVGTRHPTTYGRNQADRFGYALAQAGVTVVSGLARGIDTSAHQGALKGGGRTIAVLGGGLGQMYPPENRGLADEIIQAGAVCAEYAPMTKPHSGTFPQRNRIISGLSLAILVVEAPERSGALITARLAGEQGREALALPGAVTSRASRGCHQLIRDGATLVQTVDDILEALGPMRKPVTTDDGHEVRSPAELSLNEIERQVLDAICGAEVMVDDVISACGLPAHRVNAVISVLEMRRMVRRISGNSVVRV